MLKQLILFFLLAALLLFSGSCKKDKLDLNLNVGYSYFPVEEGHWLIYDVESIVKDGFSGQIDSAFYQVLEVIDSTFLDNQGRPTQRIERYKRNTAADPWVIHKVFTATRTATTAERVEDNIRFVKLIFPVKINSKWDGNSMNVLDSTPYEYTGVHQSYTIGTLSFDSVLTVLQIEEDFFTYYLRSEEKYASSIGKILKDSVYREICNFCGPGGIDTLTSFIEYRENLVSYSQ